jgi:putative oxygen-independent coproporphyrinogen III oxidase
VSSASPFGVYVHIPFCHRRCDYCAFVTFTDRHHLHAEYAESLAVEVRDAALPAADTVFVGGGTPSILDPALLAGVIATIPRHPDAEVTVECNPDDVTGHLLSTLVDAGVNRISIGVQSMDTDVLIRLGRWHVPDNVRRAVDLFHGAGLRSWNVDLIYGTAGESLSQWQHTVAQVLALDPPHVSAYALTVEAGTPLAADPGRHPDDDDLADKYEAADDLLVAAGLSNYEVSNWARPGHESVHNRLYWSGANYRGIGCAAHSHADGRRWWNVRTPERYVEAIRAGRSAESSAEVLDDDTRRIERLQLMLRTREGVPVEALDADGLDGLVEVLDGRAVLTRRGRLLANEVSMHLR